MHITVHTCYDIQYHTMRLSGSMNDPTEISLISIRYGMEYIMNHSHEHIMYSRNKVFKTNESPHQYFFKAGDEEIKKN